MKTIILFFILLLLTGTCYSQSNWQKVYVDSLREFTFIKFADAQTGYMSGNIMGNHFATKIYKTTNSGLNWSVVAQYEAVCEDLIVFSGEIAITSIHFPGSLYGPCTLFKTVDGGLSWSAIFTDQFSGISRLFFLNNNTGWRPSGAYMRSTGDGGYSWSQTTSPSYFAYRIHFLNPSLGYLLGSSDGIFRTVNGGANWTHVYNVNEYLNDFRFVDSLTGFIAGTNSSGYVKRTSNGGANWISVLTCPKEIKVIKFVNRFVGYALEDTSRIYRTSDCGSSWQTQNLEHGLKYQDFCFVNGSLGWIAADSGFILRTTNGGSTSVNTLPDFTVNDFFLFQNYPNPFNPVTKIKFDIQKLSFVKISVFDIAGKEIETLVNQDLKPGTYETSWNASNYSSGIYFYKIQAGEFTQTKKMILLK